MTRIIAVIGGKGGVGKTTITSNLAYALTKIGEDVIAIDANMTTPNLGIHFGMHLPKNSLHDVLKGNVNLDKVMYSHPYGFKFIPSSISTDALSGVDVSKLSKVTFNLMGAADYILMDCAAGLGREAISAINAVDEILLVTNPDLPSVADALKTADIAEKLDKNVIGVVVNRRKNNKYELGNGEIRELLELPVIAEIPEDNSIQESVSAKQPIIDYSPNCKSAIEIEKLAHKLAGRKFASRSSGDGIFDRVFSWFTK